ncbi:MAG: hypothetical protein Q4P72_06155, partial [Eubacteriales bacterium]|nr:hypothetical protein [Eubacteriales bacterium]
MIVVLSMVALFIHTRDKSDIPDDVHIGDYKLRLTSLGITEQNTLYLPFKIIGDYDEHRRFHRFDLEAKSTDIRSIEKVYLKDIEAPAFRILLDRERSRLQDFILRVGDDNAYNVRIDLSTQKSLKKAPVYILDCVRINDLRAQEYQLASDLSAVPNAYDDYLSARQRHVADKQECQSIQSGLQLEVGKRAVLIEEFAKSKGELVDDYFIHSLYEGEADYDLTGMAEDVKSQVDQHTSEIERAHQKLMESYEKCDKSLTALRIAKERYEFYKEKYKDLDVGKVETAYRKVYDELELTRMAFG